MTSFRPRPSWPRLLAPVLLLALALGGCDSPTFSKRPVTGQPAAPPGPAPEGERVAALPPPGYPAPPVPPPFPGDGPYGTLSVPTPGTVTPLPPAAAPVPGLRVGLLVPLSGANAALGEALLAAAQLALFEVGDDRLVLMPRDTGGTPAGADAAAIAALNDGAQLILGPVFAPAARAAGRQAAAAGVPVISFSSDSTVAGGNVYVMGFDPVEQTRRIVAFALEKGHQRFAALIPADPYGDVVASVFENTLRLNGGKIVAIARFDPAARDISEVVKDLGSYEARQKVLERRIAAIEQALEKGTLPGRLPGDEDGTEEGRIASASAPVPARVVDETLKTILEEELGRLQRRQTYGDVAFDAIFLPLGGDRLRAAASLLSFYDIDPERVQILGTSLWESADPGREPALVGGWFAAPTPRGHESFGKRYQEIYGAAPPRLASLAYDATALAAVLARDGAYNSAALRSANGFAGIDGIFRFTPYGAAQRGLAVLEVRPHDLRVVAPPPSTFVGP